MLSPFKIHWNGFSSLDKDLWCELSFGGNSGEASSFLSREAVFTERVDGSYRNLYNYKYNEVLAPQITLIKQDYSDFSHEENRQILSWLTSLNKPSWLEVFHDDSEVVDYRLWGNWSNIEQYKMGNSRVVGYVCTFESSSPMAFSPKYEITKQVSGVNNFTINCESDEYDKVLYPKVSIIFGVHKNASGQYDYKDLYFPATIDPLANSTYYMIPNVIYTYSGSLYVNVVNEEQTIRVTVQPTLSNGITPNSNSVGKYYYFTDNNTINTVVETKTNSGEYIYNIKKLCSVTAAVQIDNTYFFNGENIQKSTIISGGVLGETLTLDGTNKVVSSDQDSLKIMGDYFNWEWLPLANDNNTITVTGNCTVKIEWIEPRKVGDL